MSARGLASLGVFCENKARGMASLGVFCDQAIEPPVVVPPRGGGFIDAFDRFARRYEFTSRIEFHLDSLSYVEGYAPTPGALSVESTLSFRMAPESSFSGSRPEPVSLSVESLARFGLDSRSSIDGIPGTAPAPEIVPAIGSITSEIGFEFRSETTFEYEAPVVRFGSVTSEIRFELTNATRISGVKGISRDEDDVEILLLAMQFFRGDE